ncbi:MAG: metallophosphoesterase family protein [Proteobacteria bacterium]|nr:metallophosphoesterase family protein [Pseudomonadota bacterium]
MAYRRENKITIGVISDTHGTLSNSATAALQGVDHIVHAGDVVDSNIVYALNLIAPTTAVRGNMDSYETFKDLPRTAVLEFGGVSIYVLHDLTRIDLDPQAAGFSAVIHGHTHHAEIDWRDEVLFLNPGSAGTPRTARPPSIARLTIVDGGLNPEIVELDS